MKITRDEVMAMTDKDLRETVELLRFPNTRLGYTGDKLVRYYSNNEYDFVPDYPVYMEAAWELIESTWKIAQDGTIISYPHFSLLSFTTNWRAKWATPFPQECLGTEEESCFWKWIEADTAPRAITRAYILAMCDWSAIEEEENHE